MNDPAVSLSNNEVCEDRLNERRQPADRPWQNKYDETVIAEIDKELNK